MQQLIFGSQCHRAWKLFDFWWGTQLPRTYEFLRCTQKQLRAVFPLYTHVMKTYWIISAPGVSGQLHDPAALPPKKELSVLIVIGGWVGPRAGLDAVAKRENVITDSAENRTRSSSPYSQTTLAVKHAHHIYERNRIFGSIFTFTDTRGGNGILRPMDSNNFLCEFISDFLVSSPNIWTSPHFRRIHHISLNFGLLRPTQPPIQWVPGALSLAVKWPGYETDRSPPSSAEVRMRGAIPPPPIRLHEVVLSLSKRATLPYLYHHTGHCIHEDTKIFSSVNTC
jgi:hypothetical protein